MAKSFSTDEYTHILYEMCQNFPAHYARTKPMLSSSQQMTLRLQHGAIWGQVYNCKPAVKELFHATAKWRAEHDRPLIKPQAAGIGQTALFYTLDDIYGLRFEPNDVTRIDHDLMLQAEAKIHDPVALLTNEIVEIAETSGVTPEIMQAMRLRVHADPNLRACDIAFQENIGRHRGQYKYLDPRSLAWKKGCAP